SLGLERNVLRERARETVRPRAGGDHHAARDERSAVANLDFDAVEAGHKRDRIGPADATAAPLELPGQRFGHAQWVADGLPAGHKRRCDESGAKPGLELGDGLRTMQRRERDAVLRARLPTRLRRLQLRLAFVEMQYAVTTQHV